MEWFYGRLTVITFLVLGFMLSSAFLYAVYPLLKMFVIILVQ